MNMQVSNGTRSGGAGTTLAGEILAGEMSSKALRVALMGVALVANELALEAQEARVKPPAVGELVEVVNAGVTNLYRVAVTEKGTNYVRIGLKGVAGDGSEGPGLGGEWATVYPVGSILTNVVDGVTNRYRVTTEPQSNLSPVASADLRVFPIGYPDLTSGNEVANLPGTYNLVLGWQGVYKLRPQGSGTVTRPNKVPDGIKHWLPQACSTTEFLQTGSQLNGDSSSGRVVFPVNVDGAGVVVSQRGDRLFNVKFDFTDPALKEGAKAFRPGTPEHFIIGGGPMVFSDSFDGDGNLFTAHLAGSQTDASESATGYEVARARGVVGLTANEPAYVSDPLPTVALGVVTQGLELLTPDTQEKQSITISIEPPATDGQLSLGFSEALRGPSALVGGYQPSEGNFGEIATLEKGIQRVVFEPEYLKALGAEAQKSVFFRLR